jgi:colicin import membrane protein
VTETPKPPEKPQEKPVEKAQQKSEVKPPEKPQESVKKPPEKFKPDEVAKLLETVKEPDKKPPEPRKKPEKPAAKPLSGDETAESREKFDPSDISKFLSKEAPQREASKASQLQQTASLGAPNASAAKMSPSMWGALDGLLQEQYKQCWSYLGLNAKKYVPEIHVQYSPEGRLIGQPALLNPPADPQLRGLADSALRAVKRCDPLKIPAQYQPFYDQWKGRVVRFDPEDML